MDTKGFEAEMNRGFLQLLVLLILEEPSYGYLIVKTMEGKGFSIEENTLYPLLRRLESKGLISSTWEVGDSKPKKYYVITDEGRAVRAILLETWEAQNRILQAVQGQREESQ